RDVQRPRALEDDAPLSGTVGNVLDPVMSVRRVVELGSGESATLVAVLAAGADREAVLAAAARLGGEVRGEAGRAGAAGDGAAHPAMASPHGARHRETGGAPAASGPAAASAAPASTAASPPTDGAPQPLRFFNGYGGFGEDGSEYVIRLEPDGAGLRLPPAPWINVVANEAFGFLASETGAGYTWAGNSREHRLTPWFND